MKQFVFVKIDLGIDILRPKMVFVVYYLSQYWYSKCK